MITLRLFCAFLVAAAALVHASPSPGGTIVATGTAIPEGTRMVAPDQTPSSPPALAPVSPVTCGPPRSGFLRTRGILFTDTGRAVRLYGATMYPLVHVGRHTERGAAWMLTTFPAYIDTVLNLAAVARLNTIRVTDYLPTDASWDDPVIWSNMDYLLCHAQERHMFVILSLTAYRNWLERRGQFGYNPATWISFLQFVGHRYARASSLAYYALSGEAAPPNSHRPLRPTSAGLVRFYRVAAMTLWTADGGHHLISTGGLSDLNWASGIPWPTLFALPHIDLAAIHAYSPADRAATIPSVSAWAQAHRRPFVIEEFGFRQAMGDQARAAAFAALYAQGSRSRAAGMIFWNLGTELNARSYDVGPETPATWQVVRRYSRWASPSPTARSS